jgi:Acetyltransferase (GNAT) domain
MDVLFSGYSVERYEPALRMQWDAFVQHAKNGSFLFLRDYMEHHQDRFQDHSLVIRDRGELIALLPANRTGSEVHSHSGLTYGGFVVSDAMTTPGMLRIFDSVLAYLRLEGVSRLDYKTIPIIYHRVPAEEDRYALFLANATLSQRKVLSVVPAKDRPAVQTRRKRGAAKADKRGVTVFRSEDWAGYWAILSEHLETKFGAVPVHSLTEMEQLRRLFPDNIKLYVAALAGDLLAGVVIYESAMVARTQYIAASERGREACALDRLLLFLLDEVFAAKPFFDFGTSNDSEKQVLNHGLIEQKEGFGARAIVHDHYTLDL